MDPQKPQKKIVKPSERKPAPKPATSKKSAVKKVIGGAKVVKTPASSIRIKGDIPKKLKNEAGEIGKNAGSKTTVKKKKDIKKTPSQRSSQEKNIQTKSDEKKIATKKPSVKKNKVESPKKKTAEKKYVPVAVKTSIAMSKVLKSEASVKKRTTKAPVKARPQKPVSATGKTNITKAVTSAEKASRKAVKITSEESQKGSAVKIEAATRISKKPATKKTSDEKPVAKRAAVKKVAVKKTPAKGTADRKTDKGKAVAKKLPANESKQKVSARKPTVKKPVTKKSPATKPAEATRKDTKKAAQKTESKTRKITEKKQKGEAGKRIGASSVKKRSVRNAEEQIADQPEEVKKTRRKKIATTETKSAIPETPRKKRSVRRMKKESSRVLAPSDLKGAALSKDVHNALREESGESELLIYAVAPDVIYADWEIKKDDVPERANLVMRVYDVTGIQFDGINAHGFQQVMIDRRLGSGFYSFGMPGRDVVAEIGVLSGDAFMQVLRSNKILVPELVRMDELGIAKRLFGEEKPVGY